MKYLDKRIMLLKTENKGLLNYFNEMKQSPHFNENSFEVRCLKKQIWRRSKLIVDLTKEKLMLKKRMEADIEERAISAKHLDKHRNKIQQMGRKD